MDIRQNVTLATYTTFGIGGPGDYFVEVHTIEDIIEAVQWAKDKNLSFFLLGTGANILVGDKGFRGLVIKNEFGMIKDQGSMINVGSGTTIEELITFTQEKGLSGFEHFAGIPSSVGGALWQNLHFLNPDRTSTVFIGDIVESAVILGNSNNHEPITVDQSYFQFGYDYSILHDTYDIVLSAIFRLNPEDPKIIQERIDANLAWRAKKHPTNATKTSAGSIFKKIEGYGAGRLIEQVGLKGKIIGGAKISDQHANFIINNHDATAQDVRDLIDLVQKTVKQELGLDMKTEISFVGEF